MKPRARKSGLVVRELEGELLVYDLASHRAHRLNRAAAVVFQGCDGRKDVRALAARLRREVGPPADERWVKLALGRLTQAGLLEAGTEDGGRLSRRDLIRKAGRAAGIAVLLPVVTTIVAPTPAEAAASCVTDCSSATPGTPCYNSTTAQCGTDCICGPLNTCVSALDGFSACP